MKIWKYLFISICSWVRNKLYLVIRLLERVFSIIFCASFIKYTNLYAPLKFETVIDMQSLLVWYV